MIYNIDCLKLAEQLVKKGHKVILLICGSQDSKGGFYRAGFPGGQEEQIAKKSNNYMTLLEPIKYPLHATKPLWLPGLKFPTFQCDAIVAHAIKRPILVNGLLQPNDMEISCTKISEIYQLAAQYSDADTYLVSTAFGCGGYMNPPENIAQLMKDLYQSQPFKLVFGIYDENEPKCAFSVFKDVFNQYT